MAARIPSTPWMLKHVTSMSDRTFFACGDMRALIRETNSAMTEGSTLRSLRISGLLEMMMWMQGGVRHGKKERVVRRLVFRAQRPNDRLVDRVDVDLAAIRENACNVVDFLRFFVPLFGFFHIVVRYTTLGEIDVACR